MSIFKIENDDLAVRGLRADNKQPVISGPIQPVKAAKPMQQFSEELQVKPLHINKLATQRRHDDRRQTDKPVILDTRSQHDRRIKNTRHSENSEEKTDSTHRGLDETI